MISPRFNFIPSIKQQKSNVQLPKNFSTYLLQDYTFLNEYELMDSTLNTQSQILARIKSTDQLVKFIKKQYQPINTKKGLSMYKRFESMFIMFQKGLMLADNMFILEQGNKYFYYIIQPYLKIRNNQVQMPFVTLQQYLVQNKQKLIGFECRKQLLIKCKNLFDNLSLIGQPYCGLNSRKIVMDDQGITYLMPYSLQLNITNKPYQRSYYPIQILKLMKEQLSKQKQIRKEGIKQLHKWDIWSFGCIMLDIFMYLTPYYIQTSIQRQITKIQKQTQNIYRDFMNQYMKLQQNEIQQRSQCSIKEHLKEQKQRDKNKRDQIRKIFNLLINTLNKDQKQRSISFEIDRQMQIKYDQNNKQKQSRLKYNKSRIKYTRYKKNRQKINKQNNTDIIVDKQKTKDQRMIKLKNNKEQIQIQTNYQSYLLKNSDSMPISNRIYACNGLKIDQYKQLNINSINTSIHYPNKNPQLQQNLYTFQIKFKSIQIKNLSSFIRPSNHYQQLNLLVKFPNQQIFKFCIDINFNDKNINHQSNLSFQSILNKKITFINKSKLFIRQLLQQDLQINLYLNSINKFNSNKSDSQIFINLSSLTLQNQFGQRLWTKPIKGSYLSQKSSLFQSKIKIQAKLIFNQSIHNQSNQNQNQSLINKTIKIIQQNQIYYLNQQEKAISCFQNEVQNKSIQKQQSIYNQNINQNNELIIPKQLSIFTQQKQLTQSTNKYNQLKLSNQNSKFLNNQKLNDNGWISQNQKIQDRKQINNMQIRIKQKIRMSNKQNIKLGQKINLSNKIRKLLII